MRRYLIDTGMLTAYLLGRRAAVLVLEDRIRARETTTSMLVYGEIIEYLRSRSTGDREGIELRDLLRVVWPLPLSYRVMEQYADLRRELRPPSGFGLIDDVDSLIAATALVHNQIIITTDSDFLRIPDLQVEFVERETLRRT
ncbi:MAG: type II toxin-antitoxin system VapC family toxin [Chloroflexota bacterium]